MKITNTYKKKIAIVIPLLSLLVLTGIGALIIGVSRIDSLSTIPMSLVEWDARTGKVGSSPALGDVNGDGRIDVVIGSLESHIYAFDGADGSLLLNYSTDDSVRTTPALGDIDGDGILDIVVGSTDNYVYALNGSGTLLWNFSTGDAIISSPTLGDIDGDNDLDVVIGGLDYYVYALNGSGSLLWKYNTFWSVSSSPALGDIDGDGILDVVIGSDNENVYALNGSGSLLWKYPTGGYVQSSPALGDIDGDNELDIVIGSDDGYLYALNGSGIQIWNYSLGGYVQSSPVLGDIDGDNELDIIIKTYDDYVYGIKGNTGSEMWIYSPDTSIVGSVILKDIDGNNTLEVIFGCVNGKIHIITLKGGILLWLFSAGNKITSSPQVGDIDGDGNMEIVGGGFDYFQTYAIEPSIGPRLGFYNMMLGGIGLIISMVTISSITILLSVWIYYWTRKKQKNVFQQKHRESSDILKKIKQRHSKEKRNINYNIKTENLTKIYRSLLTSEDVVAVDGIDLLVENGVHGFLGPNGAGKTSTMKMLIGTIAITKGSAKIKGFEAGSVNAKSLIGYMPQQVSFYEKMTGREYLIHTAKLSGIKGKNVYVLAKQLLTRFDLIDVAERQVGKYSGGMRQKLGLAAAFITAPDILILDEPTSDLDPVGRDAIIKFVRELSKETSIFVSSHVLSEVEEMCDTATIINKGKIVLTDTITNLKKLYGDGTFRFIINTNNNSKLLSFLENEPFIQQANIDSSTGMVHAICSDESKMDDFINRIVGDHDISLRKYTQQEATLKDVFLQLIDEEVNSA